MNHLNVVYTIWLRDLTTFIRERSRIVGMIGQPLLYLLIVGVGISSGLSLNHAPGGINYLRFMYPGIIGMSTLFTSIFSAMSIIWDREFGFLKEVLVAPVPRWAVAVGKSLGGATVAVLQSIILIALAPFVGVTLTPPMVLEVLALAFLTSLAMTSLGVVFAARMDSMQGFQMVMNFLVMPLFFLSGGLFPVNSAPSWMKTLMYIDPLTYGVDGLRNVVFSGTMVKLPGGLQTSLVSLGRHAGLIRWGLGFDAGVMLLVSLILTTLGAFSFSLE